MGSVYKDRYSISGADVTHLIRRFYRYFLDSDWERADDFVKWCSENGWKKGLRLCRADTSKPHGPGNSFFKSPEMTIAAKKSGYPQEKGRTKKRRKSVLQGLYGRMQGRRGLRAVAAVLRHELGSEYSFEDCEAGSRGRTDGVPL